MADDFGDKTEAPTARRRSEARDQGQVARSHDLTSAALLLGTLLFLRWYGNDAVGAMRDFLVEMLGFQSMSDLKALTLHQTAVKHIIAIAKALAPMFVGILFVVVIINYLQVGWYFNFSRLQPNIAALNPFKGFSRLFSGRQNLMQSAMNIVKMIMVAGVSWSAISSRMDRIVMAQQMDFLQIFGLSCDLMYAVLFRIAVLLLILALLDYAWQKWRIEKELKMTKEEVKEEMRRMEGDPQIKQKRLQIGYQQAMKRLKSTVPTADVVVTNPTEFAVALKYDKATMHAPKVVAKGQGYIAMRIRELAVANGIPILERKPLARALFKLVEVGEEIPEQFYTTVAEILAYVYELTGKIQRKKAG